MNAFVIPNPALVFDAEVKAFPLPCLRDHPYRPQSRYQELANSVAETNASDPMCGVRPFTESE